MYTLIIYDYVYISAWLTDTWIAWHKHLLKKQKIESIVYTVSFSSLRVPATSESLVKIGDQMQQRLSWPTAGQKKSGEKGLYIRSHK